MKKTNVCILSLNEEHHKSQLTGKINSNQHQDIPHFF